jgi:hypothetical protein
VDEVRELASAQWDRPLSADLVSDAVAVFGRNEAASETTTVSAGVSAAARTPAKAVALAV